MAKQYIVSLSDLQADLSTVGGKGASLAQLVRAGLQVPDGFHITTAAYQAFVDANDLQARILTALSAVDVNQPATLEAASAHIGALFAEGHIPTDVVAAIEAAYGDFADAPVAVRSSATAEDLPEASFAGQQETFLNVHGVAAVLDAVKRCWASLWTARAMGYRIKNAINQETVSLAVVVQALVPAEAAGIMFTANPVNGRRDQCVISASWGLGEAVVGGLVTPDSFTVDKATLAVSSRAIADKQTMTTRTVTGTEAVSIPESKRTLPALGDAHLLELAKLGIEIEALYDMPMDIEWALDAAGDLFILQARPITALPDLELAPPTEWQVPNPQASYVRQSIIEFLPDPLSPLFGSLGLRAINAGTLALFVQIVGEDALPEQMLTTLNGYAYYGFEMTGKFWGAALTGIGSFLPKFFQGETRWRDAAHPRYLAVMARWQECPISEMDSVALLEGAYQLTVEAVNIYNVYQSGMVGLSLGAEMLFAAFYNTLVRRKGDPTALTLMLGGDSMPIQAEKSLYDIAQWCHERPDLAAYIARTPSVDLARHLRGTQSPANMDTVWGAWQARFQANLAHYGHALYNLDFATAIPADDPTPLLETLKVYIRGQGANPHARQQEQIAQREAAAQAITRRLKGWRLKWFNKLLEWAQRYVPMREDTLADIGLGYPLLRRMLRELGTRLVQAGMLEHADDVYWLEEVEARAAAAALDRGETTCDALASMSETIRYRKAQWRAAKRVVPPVGLPERAGMTKMMEKLGPTHVQEGSGHIIKGIGASPGCVSVPACVLHGPGDFNKMEPGVALVAGITTPAWTPLFALASAVVTDVGGPLSHSSIVAREYGIPAVLGTGVATKRIQTGQTIRVDGDVGEVTMLDALGNELPETTSIKELKKSRVKKIALVTLATGAVLAIVLWWRKRRRQ